LTKKIYLITISLFSILINYYFANRGVFPIDSFLIFDSSFNILSGNHPFKDYWLITGPFLDYIQSAFFILFGVNWFSYVLHASLINMMLALYSFYFFLNIGLKNFYAFIYSIGVAILAYPSIGTPFIDHHAVILCVMALYSLILGILTKKNIFWFITPIFIFFSFFSKQIPSPYIGFLFASIILFYFFRVKNTKNLFYFFLGALLSLLIVCFIFVINEIPFQNFLIQYILYPLSLGEDRISKLNLDFNNLIGQFKFIYLAIVPLLLSILLFKKSNIDNKEKKRDLLIVILFLGSVLIFIYCQLLTKNQVLIFFLIPVISGFAHSYVLKYFNKKYLVYLVLLIFIFSTGKYHLRFNHNKKFIELANADFNLAVDANKLDTKFSGLRWISPMYINEPAKEIELLIEVKNFLINIKDKKVLITDYQFFASLLNNKIASPNKWYDSLSVPDKRNKYYKEYKKFFITKINDNQIKYMYFIGKNKHSMSFFQEFISNNECIVSKKINELLVELNINKCKQLL